MLNEWMVSPKNLYVWTDLHLIKIVNFEYRFKRSLMDEYPSDAENGNTLTRDITDEANMENSNGNADAGLPNNYMR